MIQELNHMSVAGNFSIDWKKLLAKPYTLQGVTPFSTGSTTMQEGIIVLADISGFTQFVKKIDPQIGVHVIHDLLSSIIQNNEFGLNVNEIEGDAVLFYRVGKPLKMNEVVRQFELMSASFYQQLTSFNPSLGQHNLSLKLIVHYGTFSTYQIDGFTKLYGLPVIEAHRLLKNSITGNHYLLVTQNYLDITTETLEDNPYTFQQCEIYEDVGTICYYYFMKPNALRMLDPDVSDVEIDR